MIGPSFAKRLALLASVLALHACDGAPGEPATVASAAPPASVAPAAPAASASADSADLGGSGKGRRRASEAATYVDGAPVSVLRFAELPASLPTRWKTLEDGRKVRRFRLSEYVEAVGVDLASVKEVHLYGGRDRVSIVPGDALRKNREEMLFSFSQSDRGKPRAHYPGMSVMPVNTYIDAIYNVAIYARKAPPSYDLRTHTMRLADGVPIEGMPYATGERPGGTRVYVDGALASWIKRKTLPDKLVVGDEEGDARRFSLAGYLASLGVDLAQAKAVSIIANDDVVARFEGKDLAEKAAGLVFTMPPKSHGQIQLVLDTGPAKASAVMVHVKTAPPAPGSAVNQAKGESGPKSPSQRVAHTVHNDVTTK